MNSTHVCCFGEVLWDLLPSGAVPGGAPMNVALHLKNLGVDARMISRVGTDALGQDILSFVKSKGATTEYIQLDQQFPTGTVNVDVSDKTNVRYEIVQPAAWDFIEADERTRQVVRDAKALVFGTLACRKPQTHNALLTLLGETKALKIFDINLRAPFYSMELIEQLLLKADIAKLNEDELLLVAEQVNIQGESLIEKGKSLRHLFHLNKVIITRGSEGAVLLDDAGTHTSRKYSVVVKDTIGSGDSFLAGMIKNILAGESADYALNYSCALGALVAQHHGANPPISESEILTMMKQ